MRISGQGEGAGEQSDETRRISQSTSRRHTGWDAASWVQHTSSWATATRLLPDWGDRQARWLAGSLAGWLAGSPRG